jgi:hypothetical protein
VAFLTDADLVDAATRTAAGFCERLREARHLRRRLDDRGYRIADRPRAAAAGGSRLERFAGDGWVAAGDEALAFDPLSSQGLLFALARGSRPATPPNGVGPTDRSGVGGSRPREPGSRASGPPIYGPPPVAVRRIGAADGRRRQARRHGRSE